MTTNGAGPTLTTVRVRPWALAIPIAAGRITRRCYRFARHRVFLAARRFAYRSGAVSWFDRRVLARVGLGAFIRHTNNTEGVTWLGQPIWQNIADAWTLQELISERRPDVIVECGTFKGGSSFFMATLLDALGKGLVLTVDYTDHGVVATHPRVRYLHGSSVDPATVRTIAMAVAAEAPGEVMVVLDSDHTKAHVLGELRAYAPLVPVGGYVVVQDGLVDILFSLRDARPGPLAAVRQFVRENPGFVVDEERSAKFLYHSSPKGVLRRVR